MNSLTPQQSQILDLLRAAGTDGINSYGKAREVALQLPVVIEQLQKHGYIIKSVRRINRSGENGEETERRWNMCSR